MTVWPILTYVNEVNHYVLMIFVSNRHFQVVVEDVDDRIIMYESHDLYKLKDYLTKLPSCWKQFDDGKSQVGDVELNEPIISH